ncbi:MAG: hypothetical protein AAF346_00005 [Pseudomonadota bacterium]
MRFLTTFERSQLSEQERLIRLEIAVWGQDGQNGLTGTMKGLKKDLSHLKKQWAWFKLLAPLLLAGILNGASLCNKEAILGQLTKIIATAMGWGSVCGL